MRTSSRQVAIGGPDDAHVDLYGFGAAQPLELALLQHAQQLGLHFQGQLAKLIQEDRGAVRELEASDLAHQRTGERAFLAAEQLALHQCRGQRGAVDLDHYPAAARAKPVYGLGDQFLACARLARNKHGRIRGRNLLRLAEHLPNGGASANDLPMVLSHLDLGLQVVAFRLQPVLQLLDFGVGLSSASCCLLLERDIANRTVGADRAAGGVARGDSRQVMNPFLPLGRMQVSILDGDPFESAVVQFLTLVQHTLPVVRMQMFHPELHGSRDLGGSPREHRKISLKPVIHEG